MKRRIFACLLALVMLVSVLPVALAADPVAKIGNDTCATLDEAIEKAQDKDVIELLADCELTVNTISKPITINGKGKTVTVKPETDTDHKGALWLKASMTLRNTNMSFANNVDPTYWSLIMYSGTKLNILEDSDCTFTKQGIYVKANDAQINVDDSNVTFYETGYTAMMGEYGPDGNVTNELNITNGSTFTVRDTTAHNGINLFKIKVENSNLDVLRCANQGLVKCELTLDNSNANISGNADGITGYQNDNVLTMKNKSTLMMDSNTEAGIFMWGGSVDVQDGCSLTITKTGSAAPNISHIAYYAALGLYSTAGTVVFGDNADVKLIDNEVSAIYNNGTVTLGNDTVITENGKRVTKAQYGGGIDNHGILTVATDTRLYNNHALEAGDDIYNHNGASITFGKVGEDWVLDDCDPNHMIDGWYEDGLEGETPLRWNVHNTAAAKHVVKKPSGKYTKAIAYKAAHGEEYYEPGENPVADYILPALWLNTKDHYSYLIGYADGTVKPEGKITRAEVATIFFRLLTDDARAKFWMSTNNYTDVPAGKWYNNAISTLSNMGVIGGYADGTFKPDAPISRAEFAKIAVSFSNVADLSYRGYFADVKESDWFSGFVAAAKDAGLIEGYSDGTFQPEKAITRAEVCTIVNRTLGRKPSASHMKISDRIDWPDVSVTDWYYEAIMEATNSHTYQMGQRVETWNDKLPQRDWALLETGWANAYTGNGGEVN